MAKYNVYVQYNGTEDFGDLNGVKIKVTNLLGYDDLEFNTQKEDGEVFFRKKLGGDISFLKCNNEDLYDLILSFFNDINLNCEVFNLTIDKICDNGQTIIDYWKGTFTANQCKINFCNNRVEIQPLLDDEYACIMNSYDNENSEWYSYSNTVVKDTAEVFFAREVITICGQIPRLFGEPEPTPEILMTTNPALYDIDDAFATSPRPSISGYQVFTSNSGCVFVPSPMTYAVPRPVQEMPYWFIVDNVVETGGGFPGTLFWEYNTTWHRDYLVTNLNPFIFGEGWKSIGNNGVGDVYYRIPEGEEVSYPNEVVYGNGVTLKNAFNSFLSGCGVQSCSHFFNVDPQLCDGVDPLNTAYLEEYHNITIHGKSDVKRPFDGSRTKQSQWIYTLGKFLETMKKTFNVFWFINKNGHVQFEHISFFDRPTIELNCTNICNLSLIEQSIPSKITTKWTEDNGLFFDYGFVEYDSNCDDEGDINIKIDDFSTNIYEMYENERYSNEGYVFIDNEVVNNELFVRNENLKMSLPSLKLALEGWEMLLPEYSVNNTTPLPAKTVKSKKESDDIICGCHCEIDPFNKVNTSLGDGEILTISERLRSGSIKIKFGYE